MATLLVLRDGLRVAVGGPSETDVPDSELNRHINNAYRDIATKYMHHKSRKICTFPTVAAQADYGLPLDVGAVLRVWDETNSKRLPRKADRYEAEWDGDSADAQPTVYARFRDFIRLYPVPDAIYTISLFYRENITDLSLDGDEPVINQPWHHSIRLLARWYYYDEQGDLAKAEYALTAYQRWLSDKPTELSEETREDMGVEIPHLKNFKRRARQNFDTSL